MAANLGELWKKGTTEPLSADIPEGGIAIDVAAKKVYSKGNDGGIFEVGGGGFAGVHNDLAGRETADAHPMDAITGLQSSLDGKEPADDAIQTHITDVTTNPHGVTAAQAGAAPTDHTHDDIYFQETEHVQVSTGAADGSLPIVLSVDGLIDSSMLDVSVFTLQGNWDPSAGVEYPDTVGKVAGDVWAVAELIAPTGNDPIDLKDYYTFVAGDLIDQNAKVGYFMYLAEDLTFHMLKGDMNPAYYYKLDGTQAITAPFAAGGQQLKGIADGTDAQDALSVAQLGVHTDDVANPHAVTKTQVGLGSVENLTQDEQFFIGVYPDA